MNFLIASVRKDLSRWMQDRAAMLLWLGIPFLIGGLLTSMMDGGGGTPTGTLLIADEDDSFISGAVVGAFSQEQLVGTKWKVLCGCRSSQARTLACLWAA